MGVSLLVARIEHSEIREQRCEPLVRPWVSLRSTQATPISSLLVTIGLDPVVHGDVRRNASGRKTRALHRRMDARVIGERSDAVLRTAMPAHDDLQA
jgi:hypothetical protein